VSNPVVWFFVFFELDVELDFLFYVFLLLFAQFCHHRCYPSLVCSRFTPGVCCLRAPFVPFF